MGTAQRPPQDLGRPTLNTEPTNQHSAGGTCNTRRRIRCRQHDGRNEGPDTLLLDRRLPGSIIHGTDFNQSNFTFRTNRYGNDEPGPTRGDRASTEETMHCTVRYGHVTADGNPKLVCGTAGIAANRVHVHHLQWCQHAILAWSVRTVMMRAEIR